MSRRATVLLLAALGLAAIASAGIVSGPAGAAFPGRNGRIA